LTWREHADDSAVQPPFNALREEREGVNDPPDMAFVLMDELEGHPTGLLAFDALMDEQVNQE
jgi:hypothetical protein